MKRPPRLFALACLLLLACLPAAWGQLGAPRVGNIIISNAGPPAVSDDFVRANIRLKPGEPFSRAAADEDVKALYATGYFFKIEVDQETTAQGLDVIYWLQGKPILTDIQITGNHKLSLKKLMKKVTSKTGQPLDERKIFDDALAMKELYEKSGYQKTTVTAQPPVIDELAGRGTVTFVIDETPKVRIKEIIFVNATLPQKDLRKAIKTRRRWMFSWLTGSGVLKDDQFDDDKEKLIEYYQNKGFIDFAIQDIKIEYPSPKWMVIRIFVSEGQRYKVGALDIKGNNLFTTNDFIKGVKIDKQLMKLKLKPGETFTPTAFNDDLETLRDMYGAKGYLLREGAGGGTTSIVGDHTANPATGTIDVSYTIEEGEKCFIEKVIIKGNVKTKDKVLRRELAVYPGEVYDMVRVKISKSKLEQMQYFEKVDTQTQDTDVPNRKDLVIGVEEKGTGNVTVGAGFSSIESLVGFVEVKQGNFDLFNPPTFTGAGQKFTIRASVGTFLQDYEISFVEPWLLNKPLIFEFDLFHRDIDYNSVNYIYTETFDGATLSLTKALGSQALRGSISYTPEVAHVAINPGFSTNYGASYYNPTNGSPIYENANSIPPNLSTNIYDEHGTYIINKVGLSLTYDTRNNFQQPTHGQETQLSAQVATPPGDTDFYKLELHSSWFLPGFANGHIIELDARTGVVSPWGQSSRVPIFERWFLGGLYSLRGYRYQAVGPEDQFGEPLGGDTYFFSSAEYSIPIIKMLRVAAFYDIGNVYSDSFSFNPGAGRGFYEDDAGLGLRIVLPIGGGTPLRLDYGIPITHDPTFGNSGRFQFGVGYTHPF